ncbi:MAG: crotonyl-CoA carboxylase/reductase [Kofleriaceae bacterium]|nr:MAG: crotonyl-CoA carboxylase/reductase [Kofleriaceae bacterium]MBZ0232844.1 crotonyl-CoA carboxylase/reductase [Kofleriaceae bacterium]
MTPGVPDEMRAWVVREERHGDPVTAMKLETVPVPRPGVGEVLLRVKAAGVNYNHVWACRGKPVSISQLHPDEPLHIGGSDAAGVVAAVGPGVRYWKVGDEVITHPNQSCGQCAACNGLEPLSCMHQKAWGFETSWGSFGQYARVQAQQLLPRPKRLSWAEAACYGLKLFTAYRMLFVSADVKPRDRVLVWGASGGLGSYAIQLCRAVSAVPICVVSSAEKESYCRTLGAELFIDRNDFPYLSDPTPSAGPTDGMRQFRRELRALTGGEDPEIVFEHVGAQTFPTSLFVARRLGKVVICGATSGYQLTFDARYLWMHQKQIVGSHGCNQHDATRANALVEQGVIKPTLTRTFGFEHAALAHQQVLEDPTTHGSYAIVVD